MTIIPLEWPSNFKNIGWNTNLLTCLDECLINLLIGFKEQYVTTDYVTSEVHKFLSVQYKLDNYFFIE